MRVRIEETTYEGSATEIFEQLRDRTFDADAFAGTDGYIRFVRNTFRRMTGLPCELPEGSTEERARAMLFRLAEIDALEVEDDA